MAVYVCLILCVLAREIGSSGVCKISTNEIECCTDYKLKGTKCIPCIGSFGKQCSSLCNPGSCGFGCKNTCLCEDCDRLNCSCFTADTWDSRDDVQLIIVVSSGFCFVAVVTLTGYIIRRCSTKASRRKGKQFRREYTSGHTSASVSDTEQEAHRQTDRQTRQETLQSGNTTPKNRHGWETNKSICMFEYDLGQHLEN